MRIKSWQLFVLMALLILLGRWCLNYPVSVASGPSLVLGEEPRQEELSLPNSKLLNRQSEISRLKLTHRFEISGEAVAVTSYRWSFKNPYYDVDLGLAWGPRIKHYKDQLKFYQGARWLMWSYQESLEPAALQDIQSHIGNIHLIPAEGHPNLEKAIHWIHVGDPVRVRGFLVEIFGPSGELIAASSTRRDDSGDGACEIVWVEELQIGKKIYR